MTAILPQLHLYHLTLSPPTHIHHTIYGSFTAPKQHELVTVTGAGRYLTLYTVDNTTGTLQQICTYPTFAVTRTITTFRLLGQSHDHIITASDSGRITVLQYSTTKHTFVKLHDEPYGRTGCRRAVPGQYLAVDPHGRACLIAAVERSKLIYVLNRDTQSNVTISSPLEANKANVIVLSVVGVDVGYDSPLFACLEYSHANCNTEPIQLQLVQYELDLGVNSVTRKHARSVPNTSNMLISVPGETYNGPGGVIICAADTLTYARPDHPDVTCMLPRRFGLDIVDDKKGVMIITSATHVQKNMFFILLQSELGDLFKLTVTSDTSNNTVTELRCQYFDTVQLATSLCILKTGFLFVGAETSNHTLYQFTSLGDNDTTPYTTSASTGQIVQFTVRPLTNLLQVDELHSVSPLLDTKLLLPSERTPHIRTPNLYTAIGQSARSTLRNLQYGVLLNELAVTDLPGVPTNIYTIQQQSASDTRTSHIVVSFVNATIVLRVTDTVEEVSDTGIADTVCTLGIHTLADNSIVQIHTHGLYIIRNNSRTSEWKAPSKKTIVCCAYNQRQVIIGLTGGELVYFELDVRSNQLMDVARKELSTDIFAVAVGSVHTDQLRCPYFVVSLLDNTVRLLSCDPNSLLIQPAMQATGELPVSIQVVQQTHTIAGNVTQQTYLYAGLKNGLLLRSTIDMDTGNLTDTRKRVLGSKPVKLYTAYIDKQAVCIALSSQNYISYTHNNHLKLTQLTYPTLDSAASFHTDACANGVVGSVGNTLRIGAYDKLDTVFNERSVKVQYTPRKLLIHPTTYHVTSIETDQNAYSLALRQSLAAELQVDDGAAPDTEADDSSAKAGLGRWASCIRISDRSEMHTLQSIELSDNFGAFSMCHIQFAQSEELYLAVGTAQSLTFTPKKFSAAAIMLYKYINNGTALQHVHSTQVEDIPLAMTQFNRRLLVGVGTALRLYDLGQKKLLRQIELRGLSSPIVALNVANDRIYVSTQSDSIVFVQFNALHNTMTVVATSIIPRYMTCATVLDYDTVAAADKFGNVFITRLSNELKQYIESDAVVDGKKNKLTEIAAFYIGETVTAISKCTWQTGGTEWLLYTTIHGAVGALLPLSTKSEVDILVSLEMHMRAEFVNIMGRDHMSYRSYYTPVKAVTDGDLLERYAELSYDRQVAVAEQLTSSPGQLIKQLEDLRGMIV